MSTMQFDIDALRTRLTAGEKLTALASEIRMPWQSLHSALKRGVAPPATSTMRRTGTITEAYRPKMIADLAGQAEARRVLSKFVANPYPVAFLLEGETGTGKTSAALALARELGCNVEQEDFGGVIQIASGEQTADMVRDTFNRLYLTPMMGSGWKMLIVNEADRMSATAETIWLDRLENIPGRSVVVFTTNHTSKFNQRFVDRCTRIRFASDAKAVKKDIRQIIRQVWEAETGRVAPAKSVEAVMASAIIDGKISFRRLLQEIGRAIG